MNLATARTLNRLPYFVIGCALMGAKYNLDRVIAWFGFHRPWYFWNYIKPHGVAAIDALPPLDQRFFYVLLLTSVPFLIIGIYLTIWRLRSAGSPLALCLFFFVPVLNIVFFLGLSVMPPAFYPSPRRKEEPPTWLPASAAGSALLSIAIVGPIGAALAAISSEVLRNYGWGLFVALPFAMGLVSVLIYAGRTPRDFGSCLVVSCLPIVFAGLVLLAAAAEGAICLVMAAPIGLVVAGLGGLVGYAIVGNRPRTLNPAAMSLILLSAPFSTGMEALHHDAAPVRGVTSAVVIDAPPERVWPNVVAFSPIPASRDWVLHTGIAYPTRARIDGSGPGAIRHCIFTTGEFIEPIQVWNKNRLLRFSVTRQPEPMEELSPYPRLKTPHLDGYFQTRQGELRLTPLSGGRTLLTGTTWYTDEIWPAAYWRLWSDFIIHRIHLRVLNHIKHLSEISRVAMTAPQRTPVAVEN